MALPSDIVHNPPSVLQFFPHFEVSVKRSMELIALDYGLPADPWDRAPPRGGKHRTQMETAVVRLAWQIGPRYTSMYSPVASIVHAAVRNDKKFLINRPLKPYMPLSYVKDSASGIVAVMRAKKLPNRIYNVTSGVIPTAHDVVTTLEKVVPGMVQRLGIEIPAQLESVPPEYQDISRIKSDLGWEPKFDLHAMISDYVTWLEKNEY